MGDAGGLQMKSGTPSTSTAASTSWVTRPVRLLGLCRYAAVICKVRSRWLHVGTAPQGRQRGSRGRHGTTYTTLPHRPKRATKPKLAHCWHKCRAIAVQSTSCKVGSYYRLCR